MTVAQRASPGLPNTYINSFRTRAGLIPCGELRDDYPDTTPINENIDIEQRYCIEQELPTSQPYRFGIHLVLREGATGTIRVIWLAASLSAGAQSFSDGQLAVWSSASSTDDFTAANESPLAPDRASQTELLTTLPVGLDLRETQVGFRIADEQVIVIYHAEDGQLREWVPVPPIVVNDASQVVQFALWSDVNTPAYFDDVFVSTHD